MKGIIFTDTTVRDFDEEDLVLSVKERTDIVYLGQVVGMFYDDAISQECRKKIENALNEERK